MPKSNPVDEMRIADEVEPTKRQQRSHAKKAGKITKATETASSQEGCRCQSHQDETCDQKQTKQQTCIDLLSRQEGATIEELQAATGWQQHSVRGFLAGAVKKKLGLTLVSEKPDEKSPPISHFERGLIAVVETDGPVRDTEVSRVLEALPALSPDELRKEWRRLYRSQPPRLSRDLLVRAIAYRIQELRYGGLSKATSRKLAALVQVRRSDGGDSPRGHPEDQSGRAAWCVNGTAARIPSRWRRKASPTPDGTTAR